MSDEPEMVITITDVRKAGHCVKGAKEWFESYDLDFRKFVKEGIPISEFLATGDGIAQEIVDRKILRETNGKE